MNVNSSEKANVPDIKSQQRYQAEQNRDESSLQPKSMRAGRKMSGTKKS